MKAHEDRLIRVGQMTRRITEELVSLTLDKPHRTRNEERRVELLRKRHQRVMRLVK